MEQSEGPKNPLNDNAEHRAPALAPALVKEPAAATAWQAEQNGEHVIRVQVFEFKHDPLPPKIFDVAGGPLYKSEPFITEDAGSAGWSIAWLESAGPQEPAQLKFAFVRPYGDTAGEFTIREQLTSAHGHEIHQHDIAIAGDRPHLHGKQPLVAGVNIVWVSTDLDPANDVTTATPYGRIMLQRLEIPRDEDFDSIVPGRLAHHFESLSAAAVNDNFTPVQLGFGRSPSITALENGQTAITWIDTQDRLQGVFLVNDEADDAGQPVTRVRTFSASELDGSKPGVKSAHAVGAGVGGLAVLQSIEQTSILSQLFEVILSSQFFTKLAALGASGSPAAQLTDGTVQDPDAGQHQSQIGGCESDGLAHIVDESETIESLVQAVTEHQLITQSEISSPVFNRHDAEWSLDIATSGVNKSLFPAGGTPAFGDLWSSLGNLAHDQDTLAFGPTQDPEPAAPHSANPLTNPAIVRVETGADGTTNIFGLRIQGPDQTSGEMIQLSDGIGSVANPTAEIARPGYLAVWEEKTTDSDRTGDLKGRYWSFGDVTSGLAPGLVGPEFRIHAESPNLNEHDAVVTSYEVVDPAGQTAETGFLVAYVASEAGAESDYGAVKVAQLAIPIDPLTDAQGPLVGITPDGTIVELGADTGLQDDQVITVAEHARDPSAASLVNDEYVVTWISEDGHVQGTMLAPASPSETGSESATTFDPVPLDLSDISGDAPVADNQSQEVTPLENGSFVVVWVTSDGDDDDDFEIVGKIFTKTETGEWIPSETKVFITDVNVSKGSERVEFTVTPDADGSAGFEITLTMPEDYEGKSYSEQYDKKGNSRYEESDNDYSGASSPGSDEASAGAYPETLVFKADLDGGGKNATTGAGIETLENVEIECPIPKDEDQQLLATLLIAIPSQPMIPADDPNKRPDDSYFLVS